MLGLPEEMDREFVLIHEFYHAISAPDELTDPQQSYEQPNALVWLLEQQGYTKKQLKDTIHSWNKFFYDEAGYCKDFNKEWGGLEKGIDEFSKNHSSFLSSICQELENHSYYMGTLTILAEVTMKEFAEMMQPYKKITFHKDAMVGIFNPWNGSGSVLEIELDKPLTVPSSMIYDVQVEGVKPSYSYLLDDVYGLIGSAWKAPLSIEKA